MTITDEQVGRLFKKMGQLGEVCSVDLKKAAQAFLSWDPQRAREVEEGGDAFQQSLEVLEEETLKIIALHQPVASDLRRVIHTFKLGQELERLHSYIARIGRKTRKMCESSAAIPISDNYKNQFKVVQTMLDAVVSHFMDPQSKLVAAELENQQKECNILKKSIKAEVEAMVSAEIDNPSPILMMQGISRRLDNMAKLLLDIWQEVTDYSQLRR